MASFIYSAFADEISPDFNIQLDSLCKFGIPYIELRGVDGKSFVSLDDGEIASVKEKLSSHNIKVWSLGSPLGKALTNEKESQLALLDRVIAIGDRLGVNRIRMFSFYPEKGDTRAVFREKALDNVASLLDKAEKEGFILCHENEKDILGESVEDVKDLADHFGGRLRIVLDNANFVYAGKSAENAYDTLKEYIEYFHIKDCIENSIIVPPGKGKALVKETISKVNADRKGDVVLTVEPHLMDFAGLSSLTHNSEVLEHLYSFDTPYDAFACAFTLIKETVDSL